MLLPISAIDAAHNPPDYFVRNLNLSGQLIRDYETLLVLK